MDDWRELDLDRCPAYLRDTETGGETYGTLSYNRRLASSVTQGSPLMVHALLRRL